MPRVPWWATTTAAAAPIVLIGGWSLAAARRRDGYDQVSDTISELAADGAANRWIMTLVFVGVGLCYLVTAIGLRPAGPAGRLLLGLGGIATALVAVNPQPAAGPSLRHGVVAVIASVSLAVWPAASALSPTAPYRRAGLGTTLFLLALVGWFALEITWDGNRSRVGVAERVAAGTESFGPLVFIAATARSAGPAGRRTATAPGGGSAAEGLDRRDPQRSTGGDHPGEQTDESGQRGGADGDP
jgi:hypothetical membrane protein